MGDFKISSVDGVVSITLANVPNSPATLAHIFSEIGKAQLNIDMICQTAPYKDKINLSFTIDQKDLTTTLKVVGILKDKYEGLVTEVSPGKCKIMIYSELLKTQWGVAARLFKAMAENSLQVKLITTSDMEISILLDDRYHELAKSALEKEFL
jgi:aspartokinase